MLGSGMNSEKSYHILIVEDEVAHIELIKRAFSKSANHFHLSIATTIKEANLHIINNNPDLVITDYLLPDGKGIDLLDKFDTPIPLMLMTSHGDEKIAVEAMKSGALDYIPKSAEMLLELPHVAERALREWAHIIEHKQMEAALRESEKKYRSLVENINDVIFTINTSGTIVYISPSVEMVTGFLPTDLIDKNLNHIFTDHQGNPLLFLKDSQPQDNLFECQLVSAQKERLWFRLSIHPIMKEEVLLGYQGIMTEITKRKQIELELIESQEKYRALAENSPDIIMRLDKYLRLLYVSPSIKKIHTAESENLIGQFVSKVNFPTNITNFWERNVRRVFKTGKTIGRSHRVLFEGEQFHFNWQLVPEYGTDGNIQSVLCSGRDITSQKRAQARIEESETFFKQLFQQNEDAVLLITDTGKIIDANPAAIQLYSYSRTELMKGGLELLLSTKMVIILKQSMTMKPAKERFHFDSIKSKKKDDSQIIIDIQGKRIKLQGREVFYCNIKDVTQKLHIEEQMRMAQSKLIHENKMASLGLLVSGMGHEINNPNNLIMFNAPLLKDVWKDILPILEEYYSENGDFLLTGIPFSEIRDDIPELLNGIHDGSIRIKNIINDLREFVRPESNDSLGEVDINKSIKMSTSILKSQIKKFTDHFHVHYDNQLPIFTGNRQKLEQVFINLIVNALQALPSKNESVHITTSFDTTKKNICIIVKDEGIGMSEEILSRITEPFFSTKLDSGGTGLGLSISYSIIKEHKGSMEFHSIPGKGTEAIIHLPCMSQKKNT